jgi:hypothetical protein
MINSLYNFVAWWLKTGIVHQEATISKQWRGKNVSAEINKHATTYKLLEAESAILSVLRLYSKDQWEALCMCCSCCDQENAQIMETVIVICNHEL